MQQIEASGTTQQVLRSLTLVVTRMAAMMEGMAGRQRPELDHIAADLMEIQQLLGLQRADAPNPRPTSAWPEGEGRDPAQRASDPSWPRIDEEST